MSTALSKTNTENPNAVATQSGAELLVKNLEAQGVEYIFGIPGAHQYRKHEY